MTNSNTTTRRHTKRHNLSIIMMLVAATAIISYVLPRHDKTAAFTYTYEVGKPWLNPTLIAPFDFPVELSEREVERITDSVRSNFVRIYRRDDASALNQIAMLSKEVSKHLDVPAHTRQRILSDVQAAYRNGIIDQASSEQIAAGKMNEVRILDENSVAELTPTRGMLTEKQLYEHLDTTYGEVLHELRVRNYIVPNIVLDEKESQKLLDDALGHALVPRGIVQAGEAIVLNGSIVGEAQEDRIRSLEKKLTDGQNIDQTDSNLTFLGKIILIAIIMTMYWYFFVSMRYRVYSSMRNMVFLVTFMTIFIIFVFAVVSFRAKFLYLIPFAMVPIIIGSFYDARVSFFTHMMVVLITSLVAAEQAQFIIMQFLTGCIAIASMQELTRRSQLVTCAVLIFVTYMATHVAMLLSQGIDLMHVNWREWTMLFGFNCILLSFAYVGIFLVEKIFGFTSLVTLVELSDITAPTLRRLSERCPGTFQHSLQVANIAAEAAIKVGASQQLVRAGALYHDIGKLENPAFFTENQSGVNPHDSLTPEQSAHIVLRHVKDGETIADRMRLPQIVKDLIKQHHGTSTTRYFYSQACKAAGGVAVDPAPYTYAGPRPQTKEAAILMMADSCEAAARSLKDYSETSIAALVEKIVDAQIASGQFKEAPISLNQIEIVKSVFVDRLKTFYHNRISYPDDVKPAK